MCATLPGACERQFFIARTGDKQTLRPSELKRLCGFCVLSLCLARPVSRSETAWNLLPVAKLDNLIVEGQEIALTFINHKTSDPYGALFAKYHPLVSSILQTYLKKIRPQLLEAKSIWGKCKRTLVFPQQLYLANCFEESLGLSHVCWTALRTRFCEAISLIEPESPFYQFKNDLQLTGTP